MNADTALETRNNPVEHSFDDDRREEREDKVDAARGEQVDDDGEGGEGPKCAPLPEAMEPDNDDLLDALVQLVDNLRKHGTSGGPPTGAALTVEECRTCVPLVSLLVNALPPKHTLKLNKAPKGGDADQPRFTALRTTILAFFGKDLRVREDALCLPSWDQFSEDDGALQRVLLLITAMIALNQQNNLRFEKAWKVTDNGSRKDLKKALEGFVVYLNDPSRRLDDSADEIELEGGLLRAPSIRRGKRSVASMRTRLSDSLLFQPSKMPTRSSEPVIVRPLNADIKGNLESILMRKLNMQGDGGDKDVEGKNKSAPGKVADKVKSNLAALLGNRFAKPPPPQAQPSAAAAHAGLPPPPPPPPLHISSSPPPPPPPPLEGNAQSRHPQHHPLPQHHHQHQQPPPAGVMLPGLGAALPYAKTHGECTHAFCQQEKADLRQQVTDLQHQCQGYRAKTLEQAAVIMQLQEEWQRPRNKSSGHHSDNESDGGGGGGHGSSNNVNKQQLLRRRRRGKGSSTDPRVVAVENLDIHEGGLNEDVLYDMPSDSENDTARDDGISSSSSPSHSHGNIHTHARNELEDILSAQMRVDAYDNIGRDTPDANHIPEQQQQQQQQVRFVPPPPPPPPPPLPPSLGASNAMTTEKTSAAAPAKRKGWSAAVRMLRGSKHQHKHANHESNGGRSRGSAGAGDEGQHGGVNAERCRVHNAAVCLQAAARGFQTRVHVFLMRAKAHDRKRDVEALMRAMEAGGTHVRGKMLDTNRGDVNIRRHTVHTTRGALVLMNSKGIDNDASGRDGASDEGHTVDTTHHQHDQYKQQQFARLYDRPPRETDASHHTSDACFCCHLHKQRQKQRPSTAPSTTTASKSRARPEPDARHPSHSQQQQQHGKGGGGGGGGRRERRRRQRGKSMDAQDTQDTQEAMAAEAAAFDSQQRVPAVPVPINLDDMMTGSQDAWYRWFHGNPDRQKLRAVLRQRGHGAFLVRISESHRCLVLSANDCGSVRHFLLGQDRAGKHGVVGWEQKGVKRFLRCPLFDSVQELVVYYMSHPISPTCILKEAILHDPSVPLKVSLPPPPHSQPRPSRHDQGGGHSSHSGGGGAYNHHRRRSRTDSLGHQLNGVVGSSV